MMQTREHRSRRFPAPAVLALFLAACGGGGGGGAAAPPPNRAPLADAGADQTVDAGALVTVDGSASSDGDGTIRRWRWAVSSGPAVDIDGADRPQASFVVPDAANPYDLVLALTVTDDDGAAASDEVTIGVEPQAVGPPVVLAGAVAPSASQLTDSDSNDPNNRYRANDTLADAQTAPSPVTIGGYVNLPGTGPEGRSQIGGDTEDYFAVELFAEQSITLLVGDFRNADADLYLYDADGAIVDFSIEAGEVERVIVPADGNYFVNVSAFAGATSYTLAIGGTAAATATRPRIVPGQAIVRYRTDDGAADDEPEREALEALAMRMGLDRLAGAHGRQRLLGLRPAADATPLARARRGRAADKAAALTDEAQRRYWETLLTVKSLQRDPAVRSAAPNYLVTPHAVPDDEFYGLQWHYPQIRLADAWTTSNGDPGVVVAVVDTGILAAHPDLAGQFVDGYDFIRDPEVAADGDGIDPDPEETADPREPEAIAYHGSHVSGTVAARADNGVGVAGVAYGARLMPLRALGATGGTSYDVNQAVRFAAGLPNDSGLLPARPADIINLSIGGEGFNPVSQDLYRSVREAGILLVASAGNEGSDAPSYPAAYEGVLGVSAVDAQGDAAAYSNRGPAIDVAAPGGDTGADVTGDGYPDGVLSTGASGGDFAYTFLQGTSMAAPHVSGVLALMKSINPGLSPDDVDRLLQDGDLTRDLGPPGRDDDFGYGLIDARRAANAALRSIGTVVEEPRQVSASAGTLNFGSVLDRLDVDITGSGGAEVSALTSDASWLTASALTTDADGFGRYRISVDRSALGAGVYRTQLRVVSNANPLLIDIVLSVAGASRADLGTVYVLLYEEISDNVVAQTVTRLEDGDYAFVLPTVPAGRYQLYAGTDLDNDLLICDAGEACGAYLTIDQPVTLDADGDREDLLFPIEYQVSIPSPAAASAAATTAPALRRRAASP